MKTIAEIRKAYGLSNSFFARVFGYKNVRSYNKSSGKKKVEAGIIAVVEEVEKKSKPSAQSGCSSGCGGGPEFLPVCECGSRVIYQDPETGEGICPGCGTGYAIKTKES